MGRGRRETVERNVAEWWGTLRRQSFVDADPADLVQIMWELSSRLPDDTIVAADSGSAANWSSRLVKSRGRMRGSLWGTLATMGAGAPYAIGAK